jgi:hypothetical protein
MSADLEKPTKFRKNDTKQAIVSFLSHHHRHCVIFSIINRPVMSILNDSFENSNDRPFWTIDEFASNTNTGQIPILTTLKICIFEVKATRRPVGQ